MDRRKAPFNTVKYHQIVSCMCLLTITGKHCYCEIFLLVSIFECSFLKAAALCFIFVVGDEAAPRLFKLELIDWTLAVK